MMILLETREKNGTIHSLQVTLVQGQPILYNSQMNNCHGDKNLSVYTLSVTVQAGWIFYPWLSTF